MVNTIFGAIVVVSGLGATLLGGIVGDRLRPRFAGSYFLVSGLSMLVAFPLFLAILYIPFRPFPWAWICLFLACFFLFFNTGPTDTILANVSHPAFRAQAYALNILFIHLFGDAVSPKIMGRIADRFAVGGRADMNAAFLAVSGMILLGGPPLAGRDTLPGTRYGPRSSSPRRLTHTLRISPVHGASKQVCSPLLALRLWRIYFTSPRASTRSIGVHRAHGEMGLWQGLVRIPGDSPCVRTPPSLSAHLCAGSSSLASPSV